jgi:uncharacterized protein (TIGR02596 family)
MNFPPLPHRKHRSFAFTLLELLVVLGIMAVIFGLAVPSLTGISEGRSLNDAASQLIAYLDAARQQALAQSKNVEVRIYTLPAKPPETFARIGAIQSFHKNADDTFTALGKPEFLPERIALAGTFSTLANSANAKKRSDGELPGMSSVPYHYFTFKSDGSTDLDLSTASGEAWYLTLVLSRTIPSLPTNTTTAPAHNFITIQLDPLTGRTQTFRPH